MGRLQKLVDLLKRENQVLAIEQDIHERVNDQMDKTSGITICVSRCE